MNAQEIIEHLDDAMTSTLEPCLGMLEEYSAFADTRLTVFRSGKHWVMAFELVHYTRADEFVLDIWLYGNCLGLPNDDNLGIDLSRVLFTMPPDMKLKETEETEDWGYAPDFFAIQRNGHRFEFRPTREEYEAAELFWSKQEKRENHIHPKHLLRFLCHHLDHPFFAEESTLRDLIEKRHAEWNDLDLGWGQRLSHSLKLFLQTREWRHPQLNEVDDWSNENIAENLPSQVECFHILARAIESGDLSEWYAQDQSTFNTHWSHWTTSEKEQEEAIEGDRARWRLAMEKYTPEERRELEEELKKGLAEFCSPSAGLSYSSLVEINGEMFSIYPELFEDD